MKRIGKFIKKRIKLMAAFILGIIVAGTGVFTATAITGISVGYTDTNDIGEVTVQGAIDKVYQIATDHECKTGYKKDQTTSDGYTCISLAANYISNIQTLEDVADAKRYVGSNVDNYVTFNGETAGWRIIGVYGDNLKIIKVNSIGGISYNSSQGSTSWGESSLQSYLNSNESGGYYYSLTSAAKQMIEENGEWNVGIHTQGYYASTAYTAAQNTKWTGKVGLLAAYEYLYAADSSCWNTAGSNYSSSCASTDWMKNIQTESWFITPRNDTHLVLKCSSDGQISNDNLDRGYYVHPVVYLKSTVTITGGTGTSNDPYTLG